MQAKASTRRQRIGEAAVTGAQMHQPIFAHASAGDLAKEKSKMHSARKLCRRHTRTRTRTLSMAQTTGHLFHDPTCQHKNCP